MSLVTTKQLLLDARIGGYAVGAFNVENMEMVQAVAAAAEELKSPIIMQTTPGTLKYADVDYFFANAKVAAQKASVPIWNRRFICSKTLSRRGQGFHIAFNKLMPSPEPEFWWSGHKPQWVQSTG